MLTTTVKTAKKLLPLRALLIFSLGILATALYFGQYVGRLEPLAPGLAQTTQTLAQQAARELPIEAMPPPLVVLPPQGDHSRTLRDQLHRAIAAQGHYPVLNLGPLGDALNRVGIDTPMAASAEEAARLGRLLGAERILWGELERLGPEGRQFALRLQLIDAAGQPLWQGDYASEPPSPLQRQLQQHAPGALGLSLLWLLLTLALPLLVWPITQRLLRRDSNQASGLLLLLLTGLSTGTAWLLAHYAAQWPLERSLILVLPLAALLALWLHHWLCCRLLRVVK